jgi:DNA-binding NarL/FixJ family response regulator
MSIRVVIVDDQAVVRAGFRTMLGEEPDLEVVGQAGDGREGVRLARTLEPDIVLMDVRMPEMDGIEATRRIVDDRSADLPRVLVLTTFDIDEYVFAALRAGASGFLLKDAEPDEIITAVRVVASGESLLAPQVTRRLIEEFVRATPRPVSAPADVGLLTPRETEVLTLAARGLSNAEIAESLCVGASTVKTHMNNVLSKLHLRDRVQATIFAYDAGLVQPGS